MYRFWVFGILLVAVPAFVGTGLQAQETVKVDKNAAKALYKEGKVLIKKKQYLKAAEKICRSLQDRPHISKITLSRGLLLP